VAERQQIFFQVAIAWNDRGYRFVLSQRPEQDVNILCLEHGYTYLAMLTPPLPLGLADFVLRRVSSPEEQKGTRFSLASWTASPQHQSSWLERLRWRLLQWWWQVRHRSPFPVPDGLRLTAARFLEVHRVLAFLVRQHPRRTGALPMSLLPWILEGPQRQRPRVLKAQMQGAARPGEVRWREEDCQWLGGLLGGRALLRQEIGQALRENVGEVPHFLRRKLADYGHFEEDGGEGRAGEAAREGEAEGTAFAGGAGSRPKAAKDSAEGRPAAGRKRHLPAWVPEEVDELLRAMAWRGKIGFRPGVALNEKGEAFCERCGEKRSIEAEPCPFCGRRMCLRCSECEGLGESRQCQPFYTLPLPEGDRAETVSALTNPGEQPGATPGEQGQERGETPAHLSEENGAVRETRGENGKTRGKNGEAKETSNGEKQGRPWEMALSFELTPAQKQAEEEVRQFAAGLRGGEEGLLWAVCGAGKTEVTFRAVSETLQQGKRVLFAIPRRDVVIELEPRLQRAFPMARVLGLYGGSRGKFGKADIYVATTHQTMRFYQAFDLVILDEADAYPYPESRMLHFAVQRARRPRGKVLYLTATPSPEMYARAREGKMFLSRIPVRHHGFPLPEPQVVLERGLSYPRQLMEAGEERPGGRAEKAAPSRETAERGRGNLDETAPGEVRGAAASAGGAGAGGGKAGAGGKGASAAGTGRGAESPGSEQSGKAAEGSGEDFAERAWREAFGLKGYVKWTPPPSLMEAIRQTVEDDAAQLMIFVPGVRIAEWVAGVLRRQTLRWKGDFEPWWGERRWVEYAHARDPNRDAKRTAFARGDFPVLVTTTILERGITIPRLNVAVLFADAEKIFDAGSLVQIAGRVGRTDACPAGRVWFIARRETAAMKLAQQMIAEMNAEARRRGYLRT